MLNMFQDITSNQPLWTLASVSPPLVIYGIASIVYLALVYDLTQPWVPKGTRTLDPFPIETPNPKRPEGSPLFF